MSIKKVFIAHSWTDVGVNIQTKAVAKKLSETMDVTFISQARIAKTKARESDHLKVIEWPNKRPNGFKDFFFLVRLLRKEKPDALIVHFGATNICMVASWLTGVKYRICWMHTLSSQYFLDSGKKAMARLAIFFRRQACRLATHVVVLNSNGKKDAIEHFKVKPKKIFTIYNGIDAPVLSGSYNKQIKSIRYCGRLDRSKGIDLLIRAFALVYKQNKDVVLEIAGRGSEEESILQMITEEQLQDAVKIHGYFYQYDKALQFVSEAYCVVLPSRMDNFPTVVLEALSSGVPVIASDAGGIPDMIENGKDGLLIEKENVTALAEAIRKLVTNESLRNTMSAQATENFTEKFSMEKHVDNVFDFLQSINTNN